MSSVTTAFIFSDPWLDDPIMKGLRDGTLSWADAAEMEGLLSVEVAPSTPPSTRNPLQCPGAPRKPRVNFAEELRSYAEAPIRVAIPSYTVGIKTIMTRNLPRFVTADILRATFEKYGPIKDIYTSVLSRASPLSSIHWRQTQQTHLKANMVNSPSAGTKSQSSSPRQTDNPMKYQ